MLAQDTPRGRAILAGTVLFALLALGGFVLTANAAYKLLRWDRAKAVYVATDSGTIYYRKSDPSRTFSEVHYSFKKKDGSDVQLRFRTGRIDPKVIDILYDPSVKAVIEDRDGDRWAWGSTMPTLLAVGLVLMAIGGIPCVIGGVMLYSGRDGTKDEWRAKWRGTPALTGDAIASTVPSPRAARRATAREVPDAGAGDLWLKVILWGMGGFLVLMLFVGMALWATSGKSRPTPAGGEDPQASGPNAPEPNQGPPPKGWAILFRSDDPAVWNAERAEPNFAVPVRRAHASIRYLRLKRIDTGEFLIQPIAHKQLAVEDRPNPNEGFWWNGTGSEGWGARHLGLIQVPPVGTTQAGVVGMGGDTLFTGSGFGHALAVNDKQRYCWMGREIARTTFEIAVTADSLTTEEAGRLTNPPEGATRPEGWTVLFRSDNPTAWNTFGSGEAFARPVTWAPRGTRYLRLKRMDTGDAEIIPVVRDDLFRQPKPLPAKAFAWIGSGEYAYNSRHFGIAHPPRYGFPGRNGLFSVGIEGWDAVTGSGFGGKYGSPDKQYCGWKGELISKTAFEIAVTPGPLTGEEERLRLR